MLTLEDVIPMSVTDWIAPESHPLRGQKGQMFAYAVRHPAGLILFETGFGRDSNYMNELYHCVHRPIETALEGVGLQKDDVHAIVNSHLHFDHCGSNALFPGVPIYVQADEYRAAHQPNYTVQRWVDFPDADYHQIEGDREIAPGVRILSTRGHTPGHQSLLVETNSGPVVLAGQAMYWKQEYESILRDGTLALDDPLHLGFSQEDYPAYVASAQRLIGLHGRRVFFSHDAAVYESSS